MKHGSKKRTQKTISQKLFVQADWQSCVTGSPKQSRVRLYYCATLLSAYSCLILGRNKKKPISRFVTLSSLLVCSSSCGKAQVARRVGLAQSSTHGCSTMFGSVAQHWVADSAWWATTPEDHGQPTAHQGSTRQASSTNPLSTPAPRQEPRRRSRPRTLMLATELNLKQTRPGTKPTPGTLNKASSFKRCCRSLRGFLFFPLETFATRCLVGHSYFTQRSFLATSALPALRYSAYTSPCRIESFILTHPP